MVTIDGVRNPVPPIVLFIALFLAGIYSFATMEVTNNPDIDLAMHPCHANPDTGQGNGCGSESQLLGETNCGLHYPWEGECVDGSCHLDGLVTRNGETRPSHSGTNRGGGENGLRFLPGN